MNAQTFRYVAAMLIGLAICVVWIATERFSVPLSRQSLTDAFGPKLLSAIFASVSFFGLIICRNLKSFKLLTLLFSVIGAVSVILVFWLSKTSAETSFLDRVRAGVDPVRDIVLFLIAVPIFYLVLTSAIRRFAEAEQTAATHKLLKQLQHPKGRNGAR